MSTARIYHTKYLAKVALVNFVILGSLLLTAKLLFAQETSSKVITISPPTVNQELDPGEIAEGTLRVINDSDTAITFKAITRDFIVEDTKGTPVILSNDVLSKKYSAASWLAVIPDSFTIAPGQSQQLAYYLQIPLDAKPGGRYTAVMYEPQERTVVPGTGTGVETHLGSLFYVRVKGDIVENAEVKEFGASGFSEYGPVKLTTEIKNNSGIHIRPKGSITVKNMLGQVVETQTLPEHNIFPEVSRVFENSFGKKYMFGRYTATLTATYGINNNLPLVATAGFIVLPWKIAGLAALGIIAVVLLIIYMGRKKQRKHEETPQAPQVPTTT